MQARGPANPVPSCRRAVREKFSCKNDLCGTPRQRVKVVLRGLDPRIHVFLSTVPRRGWPGRARPRRNWGAISFPWSRQIFPRTALLVPGRLCRLDRGGRVCCSRRPLRGGHSADCRRSPVAWLDEAGTVGLRVFNNDERYDGRNHRGPRSGRSAASARRHLGRRRGKFRVVLGECDTGRAVPAR